MFEITKHSVPKTSLIVTLFMYMKMVMIGNVVDSFINVYLLFNKIDDLRPEARYKGLMICEKKTCIIVYIINLYLSRPRCDVGKDSN